MDDSEQRKPSSDLIPPVVRAHKRPEPVTMRAAEFGPIGRAFDRTLFGVTMLAISAVVAMLVALLVETFGAGLLWAVPILALAYAIGWAADKSTAP